MDTRNPLSRPSGVDMTIEEQRKSYDKLENMVKEMGDLKNILNNKQVLLSILTSNVDRHLLCAFFEEINREKARGNLDDRDLATLRSGWLVEQIINLETLANQAGREIFPFEIGDKLNYLSLIRDVPTLNANYANPKLIEAINHAMDSKTRQQLIFWFDAALPLETKLRIAQAFLQTGNVDISMRFIADTANSLKVGREREERFQEHQSRSR